MFNGFLTSIARKNILSVLFSILGALLISYLVYSPRMPLNLDITIGEPALQTIRSPQYIEFQTQEDREKTAQLRQARKQLINPIYSIDNTVQKQINQDIISFFTLLRSDDTGAIEQYSFLSPSEKTLLLNLSPLQLTELNGIV